MSDKREFVSQALDEAKSRLVTAKGRLALGSVDERQLAELERDVQEATKLLADAERRELADKEKPK
jgi:hypothetical protein